MLQTRKTELLSRMRPCIEQPNGEHLNRSPFVSGPRTMPKIVDHQERRLAFAEAAFRVIAREGIEGVTVRAIAKEAGFTTGALAHYFNSKDQVLIQASSYISIIVRGRMQDAQQQFKGLKALRRVVYEALPVSDELRGNWKVWLGLWLRSTKNREVGSLMERQYLEWLDRIAMLVEGAQETGELPADLDPKVVAHSIVAVVDGIGARVMMVGSDMSARQQKALVDLVIDRFAQAESNANTPKAKSMRNGARQRNGRAHAP